MTHSAGLACNDNDDASPGNEDTHAEPARAARLVEIHARPADGHDPGIRYAYCSANIEPGRRRADHGAPRTWLPEYFERTVARPLQFGR